jgi:hypothetical protein
MLSSQTAVWSFLTWVILPARNIINFSFVGNPSILWCAILRELLEPNLPRYLNNLQTVSPPFPILKLFVVWYVFNQSYNFQSLVCSSYRTKKSCPQITTASRSSLFQIGRTACRFQNLGRTKSVRSKFRNRFQNLGRTKSVRSKFWNFLPFTAKFYRRRLNFTESG